MREYGVTALDDVGFEIASSIEANLKDAKARARYFVSVEYARVSGVTDIRKPEMLTFDIRPVNLPRPQFRRKVGGIWFFRVGKYRLSFCRVKG